MDQILVYEEYKSNIVAHNGNNEEQFGNFEPQVNFNEQWNVVVVLILILSKYFIILNDVKHSIVEVFLNMMH